MPVDPSTFDAFTYSFEVVAKVLLDAVASSNWALVVAVVLAVVVAGIRKFATPYVPWLRTDEGSVVLVFAMSAFGAAATALKAGAPFSVDLCVDALKVAWMASGGFTFLKKLVVPMARKAFPALLKG